MNLCPRDDTPSSIWFLVATSWLIAPTLAQTRLTLTEAIARARAQNPDAGSTAAAEREAALRAGQAGGGYQAARGEHET